MARTREVHHGHYLLSVHTLGYNALQWGQLLGSVVADAMRTRDLISTSDPMQSALGRLLANQQGLVAALSDERGPPHELSADRVRLLITAARRAELTHLADGLAEMFNTLPGRVE